MNIQQIHEFLNSHQTCVLASVNGEDQPQAATVGFSHDDNFRVLIATNQSSRKYANIISNHKVAIVVGIEGSVTVQYEGLAEEKTTEELGEMLEKHYQKVPGASKFASEQGQTYFLITPSWLRYYDLATDTKHEFTEFNYAT